MNMCDRITQICFCLYYWILFSPGKLKRKFDDVEIDEAKHTGNIPLKGCESLVKTETSLQNPRNSDKKQATEGFSWWTCLQLGMPLSNTKPQPKKC